MTRSEKVRWHMPDVLPAAAPRRAKRLLGALTPVAAALVTTVLVNLGGLTAACAVEVQAVLRLFG